MVKKSKLMFIFVSLTIFSILFTNLSRFTFGAINNISLNLELNNISYDEYATVDGTFDNATSFEIDLPQSGWTAEHLDFNFSNIKLEREELTVEDQAYESISLYYTNTQIKDLLLYVQLNLEVRTELFGIYIYGKTFISPENITFQIQGFDSTNLIPNGTLYKSINLNMNTTEGWFLQDFSSDSVVLERGNYSLVINATERITSINNIYILRWYHNGAVAPLTSGLHSGMYKKIGPSSFTWDKLNNTFLYRTIQKYDKTFFPEEISMNATINGNTYSISNNSIVGLGDLSISCDFFLLNDKINIEISNVEFLLIKFSVHYSVSLHRTRNSTSTLTIRENSDITWDLTFSTNRAGYSLFEVNFDYSQFYWYNFSLFRNGIKINIDPSINITNNVIFFYNDSFIEDSLNWRFEASSHQVNELLGLSFPITLETIEIGMDLEFSVSAPQGNITVIVINSNGLEKNRSVFEHTSGTYEYDYQIPSNAYTGLWEVLIFWNNLTHAASRSQTFNVTLPITPEVPETPNGTSGIDPAVLIGTVVAIFGSIILGASGYQGYRIMKRRFDEKKKKLLNVFGDIMNIKYLIVSEKTSGLNLYEKKIGTGKQDALLISGYLNAISKFEIAFTESDSLSQSIKLEYQDSKILISDFKGFRITLIMKKNPSKYIIDSIKSLSYEIDRDYGKAFKNFDGTTSPFKGLGPLIEKNLRLYLIHPFQISELKLEDITIFEKPILNRARELLQTMKHFYIVHLIPENMWNYRNLKIVLKLIDKGIFVPDSSSKGEIVK
ncbi:MAG: hypothetical protein JW891_06375 [Candidatus Lokiarchaeota archaeon]|nr:hypothetical protein [Candidatus Lokiarchaeota archaeon]